MGTHDTTATNIQLHILEQVAQLWQRPHELDQLFQVGGQFEAKL